MQITGDILIGQTAVVVGEKTYRATNPDTGEMLEPAFALAGPQQVRQACALAEDAAAEYRQLPLDRRAGWLEAIAEEILALGDDLVTRAGLETGLSDGRLRAERDRTVRQLRLFAEVVRAGDWLDLRIDTALPERRPLPRPDLRLRQIPLGPVAVFGASNFPLAFSTAGGDTASALAAGCPVVVKGHPAHPGTGELVGRAIQKAARQTGMPEGIFSLLLGGIETGQALVADPAIKAVGFTGSRGGGLALVAAAALRPQPIPVFAEMSSINPVILLPGALRRRGAELAAGFVSSLTVDAGQYCTNPGLIFAIGGPELQPFRAAVEARLEEVPASPMLTPTIYEAYSRGVARFADHPDVTVGGRGVEAAGRNRAPAAVFETTAEAFAADPALAGEIFGASAILVRCRDLGDLRNAVAGIEGQLTATLHVEDEDHDGARLLMPILEQKAGRILANGWPTGVEVSHAMVHGGPFPATSDSRATSVGTLAIRRFLRPVSYQNMPAELLPPELQPNASSLPMMIDGVRSGSSPP